MNTHVNLESNKLLIQIGEWRMGQRDVELTKDRINNTACGKNLHLLNALSVWYKL